MTRSKEVRAFVALGSNLGDRRAILEGAVRALGGRSGVRVVRVSPWIQTRAVGGPSGQPDYLNGVVELDCELPVHRLLELCLAVERDFGRDREHEVRYGPRTLDLDILLFGDAVVDEPGLTVPHPRLEERTFVLEPLAHLIPERRLRISGRTVAERLAELEAAALDQAHCTA